jgi:hypothetical protein
MDRYLILYTKTKGGPAHYAFAWGRSAIEARKAFRGDRRQVRHIISVWREVGGWK